MRHLNVPLVLSLTLTLILFILPLCHAKEVIHPGDSLWPLEPVTVDGKEIMQKMNASDIDECHDDVAHFMPGIRINGTLLRDDVKNETRTGFNAYIAYCCHANWVFELGECIQPPVNKYHKNRKV